MRKLIFILIMLFIVYFGVQFLFVYFGTGHDVSYDIKYNGKFVNITEKFFANNKNEADSYYINIDVDGDKFNFQVFDGFGKSSHILKSIEYFNDGKISCIIPFFRDDKVLFDVTCKKNNVVIPYHNLKDVSDDLISFVDGLKSYNYVEGNYIDNIEKTEIEGPLTVYSNNIVTNHYVSVTNYKGLYNISSEGISSRLPFEQDVYQQLINGYTNDTYVVADYNNAIKDFNKFYYIRMYGGYDSINLNFTISLNSYIQGSVGDSIYIFDRSNKKQYEVNTKTLNVLEVGNMETGLKYYGDGEWSRVDISNSEVFFGSEYANDYVNDYYDKVVKYGNNVGYYYLYKKVGNKYEVYRADIYDKEYVTYLFNTTNINNVKYRGNYIYYVDGKEVKYYSDITGNRTIFSNSEFEFNKTLIWSVYDSSK